MVASSSPTRTTWFRRHRAPRPARALTSLGRYFLAFARSAHTTSRIFTDQLARAAADSETSPTLPLVRSLPPSSTPLLPYSLLLTCNTCSPTHSLNPHIHAHSSKRVCTEWGLPLLFLTAIRHPYQTEARQVPVTARCLYWLAQPRRHVHGVMHAHVDRALLCERAAQCVSVSFFLSSSHSLRACWGAGTTGIQEA
jgi:hypothetical protein